MRTRTSPRRPPGFAAGAARRLGLPHGAVTVARRPAAYLGRGPAPPALTGIGEMLRLVRDAGADFVVLLPRATVTSDRRLEMR